MSRVFLLLVAFVLSSAWPAAAQVQGGTTPGVPIRPPQRPLPPRDQSTAPATGTAKIRGVVVASDDGRPLRRVVVRVTASELRVARMAADGMTNREIAQALFLTENTIETHLRSVFRKLEIGSRSQLARAL